MQELYLIRNAVVEHLRKQIDAYHHYKKMFRVHDYTKEQEKTIMVIYDYLEVYYLLDRYCPRHAEAQGSQAFNTSIVLESHAILKDTEGGGG